MYLRVLLKSYTAGGKQLVEGIDFFIVDYRIGTRGVDGFTKLQDSNNVMQKMVRI
jgi:hypothetical protein